MRKLTKTINKRRKNYKPTIGLELENGKKVSVNAVVYYIEKDREAKIEAERHAKKFVSDFFRKVMPQAAALMDYIGTVSNACYYW